METGIAQTLTM